MILKLIHIVLNSVFPENCLACGSKKAVICEKCLESIIKNDSKTLYENNGNINQLIIAGDYKNPVIKKAVWLFKYRGIRRFSKPLADLLFLSRKKHGNAPLEDMIIPIPISKEKFKKRGYNQSYLLASILAEKLKLAVFEDVLLKKFNTMSQVETKNRKKRIANLKGSFAVNSSELLKNKTVLLVDDITTTGATLNEAAFVLKKNGAKKVIGLVVARG